MNWRDGKETRQQAAMAEYGRQHHKTIIGWMLVGRYWPVLVGLAILGALYFGGRWMRRHMPAAPEITPASLDLGIGGLLIMSGFVMVGLGWHGFHRWAHGGSAVPSIVLAVTLMMLGCGAFAATAGWRP